MQSITATRPTVAGRTRRTRRNLRSKLFLFFLLQESICLLPCESSASPYTLCELGSETATVVHDTSTNLWTIQNSFRTPPANATTVLAKACWCVTSATQAEHPFYCPAKFDTCRVDQGSWKITCLILGNVEEEQPRASDWVVPFMGPFVILLYIGLFMMLVCSRKGSMAREYVSIYMRLILGSCWRILVWYVCCFKRQAFSSNNIDDDNEQHLDLEWTERSRELRNRSLDWNLRRFRGYVGSILLYHGIVRERNELQALGQTDAQLAPTHLELRTKVYHCDNEEADSGEDQVSAEDDHCEGDKETAAVANDGADGDEEAPRIRQDDDDHAINDFDLDNDDVICAICMGEVQNGDRVGNLPCRHLFHVDCLKQWLRKKNECPMCSAKDIATRKAAPPQATQG